MKTKQDRPKISQIFEWYDHLDNENTYNSKGKIVDLNDLFKLLHIVDPKKIKGDSLAELKDSASGLNSK